jgi:hypothetical protein
MQLQFNLRLKDSGSAQPFDIDLTAFRIIDVHTMVAAILRKSLHDTRQTKAVVAMKVCDADVVYAACGDISPNQLPLHPFPGVK